jgi:hypothetical protein
VLVAAEEDEEDRTLVEEGEKEKETEKLELSLSSSDDDEDDEDDISARPKKGKKNQRMKDSGTEFDQVANRTNSPTACRTVIFLAQYFLYDSV